MEHSIIDSMKIRRSIYNLGNQLTISKAEIEDAIKEVVKYAPTAFNSQTPRLLVLYGKENDWLWSQVFERVKPLLAAGQEHATQQKIASFNRGAGTILFFEELATVKQLEKDFPLYSENFILWSNHASGLTQFAVWTVLAELGIGASLQHYSNLIEADVIARYELPETWSLRAEMPFGTIEGIPGSKQFQNIDERVLVRG
jgi:predicted oxidoreductase (fatty acid repression mutant protein)